MKRLILLVLTVIVALSVSGACADIKIEGTVSGLLVQNYSNGVYADVVKAWTAEGYISTTYSASAVNRSYEIRDTFNDTLGGLSVPPTDPAGDFPDWMTFKTTENATGNWAYNDLSYEKKHWQYVPGAGKLTGSSSVDFATGDVSFFNALAHAGNRDMTHEVGAYGDWVNRVGAATTNGNYSIKMGTTANLGSGIVNFNGYGAYSPSQADVYAANNAFMYVDGVFNGAVIDFEGGLYDVDHTGNKGWGWYFDITN